MLATLALAAVLSGAPTYESLDAEAVEVPTDGRTFIDEFWTVITGNFVPPDDEFARRRVEKEAKAKQAEALKKNYRFKAPKVEIAEYDFKKKRFVLSLASLITMPDQNVHVSFQPIQSVKGGMPAITNWMVKVRPTLKAPTLVIPMKSDEAAEAWKNAHSSVSASFICSLGARWSVGSTVNATEGIALKNCVVRFFADDGTVLGDVRN